MFSKILVYPYSGKAFPHVLYLRSLGYDVVPVTFKESRLIGEDASFAVNRRPIGIKVIDIDSFLIENANDKCIIIYSFEHHQENDSSKTSDRINYYNFKLKSYELSQFDLDNSYVTYNFDKLFSYNSMDNKFYTPKIPIILVSGLLENIDNSSVAFSILKGINEENNKTVLISNDKISQQIGALPFPKDFLNNYLPVEQRIMVFNNFIKYLATNKNPDAIIVQVPGGLIRFDDNFHNNFGLYNYMLREAVRCDYFILTLNYDYINPKYISKLLKYSRIRQTEINSIHCSNISIMDDTLYNEPMNHQHTFSNFLDLQRIIKDCDWFNEVLIGDIYDKDYCNIVIKDIFKEVWSDE